MNLDNDTTIRSGNLIEVIESQADYSLILGDALHILQTFPNDCIDCVITSPPYWKLREYDIDEEFSEDEIGIENDPKEYVNKLAQIFREIYRVLKPSGSVWLNIGDKYHNKNLMGMPWRVALAMQDDGWVLRNDIIWDQMKGTQSPKDRLRDVYEHIFHFVKSQKYFYDADKIRIKNEKLPIIDEFNTISATGVSGVKYRKQITESILLNDEEKQNALNSLENTLKRLRNGEIVDFRMTIRGAQRTFHSNNGKISGRAKELEEKGFFILSSDAKGFIPSDIWRVVPEDKWRKDTHYAVFPEELILNPIKATCPDNGIVLDPFVGTGSSVVAALRLQKKGIGIDLSEGYLKTAKKRIEEQIVAINGQFQLKF
ncbi:MAG: site-specific DNA-methyltransferase [Microscillaceae bacterium]|jgi:DNA modification methylase|nr:site-specific DNA-methyltransferase [Microscillaceae bacterium]